MSITRSAFEPRKKGLLVKNKMCLTFPLFFELLIALGAETVDVVFIVVVSFVC